MIGNLHEPLLEGLAHDFDHLIFIEELEQPSRKAVEVRSQGSDIDRPRVRSERVDGA